jgi:hypothetical protein
MFFCVNPKSKVGKFTLRIRLHFAAAYSINSSKDCIRLSRQSREMSQSCIALRNMARLAREADKPFQFIWLQLCAKIASYRADRALERARKFSASSDYWQEKAKSILKSLDWDHK